MLPTFRYSFMAYYRDIASNVAQFSPSALCVTMQWRLHYTLVFRHIQQRATEWRVVITHARCPIPFHSVPLRPKSPAPKIFEWGPPSETWAAVVAITTGHHMLQLPPVPLCSCVRARACVCVCVLNIAIYHANAFFNFNMPPGIIKTLQTHNMSQEPRAVEKRHGGKLSPQMMGYHRLHGAKICLIRSSDNILFQFTPASYRTYHILFITYDSTSMYITYHNLIIPICVPFRKSLLFECP